MTLRRRRLGRTGLEVSELAFGGGWVGGVLIHRDEDTRRAALARALEAGIDLVDTAPSYGDGESERTLGRLLGSFDRAPYIATKARLDTAALADPVGEIERSLAGSLERLRRDSVDVLQLHNPIAAATDSRHVAADRVLGDVADALDGLRAQGLVRFIGVTALGEAAAVRRVVASGRFDTAQVYSNMLNPSAGRTMPAAWEGHDFSGVLDACRAADVGVMNIRVFAAGVLAGGRRHGREVPVVDDSALDREERRAAAVFAALGGGYGTRAQTALRFALAEERIAAVVVGMAELGHLEQALAAAGEGPLPAPALAQIDAVHAGNFGLG